MAVNVVFRVDGGSRLPHDEDRKRGMGHVARCIALADELEKNPNVKTTFIMKNHLAGVKKVLDAGYVVKRLPAKSDMGADVKQIRNLLDRIGPKVVITDVLNTGKTYMSGIKETGAFLLNVDDLGPGMELADTLVYSLVRPPAHPRRNVYAGPSYITLKDEFKKMHCMAKKIKPRVDRVLVSMGASDPQSLTVKAMKALGKIEQDFKTTVVIGSAYTHHSELKGLLRKPRRKYVVKSNVSNMAERMYGADLALISGGVSVYEVAAIGTPSIVLCQNEHENTNAFEDYGFVIKLGLGERVTLNQTIDAVKNLSNDIRLRRKLSETGKKLVDGCGAERVARIVLEKCGLSR